MTMSFANRTEQRDHIHTSLAFLLDPLRRLIYSDGDISKELPFVRAQYLKEWPQYHKEVGAYCECGDVSFNAELMLVHTFLHRIQKYLNTAGAMDRQGRIEGFDVLRKDLLDVIRKIPCEFDPLAIDRGSPFQGYLAIRALCAGAGSQLEIFDPYLGPDIFHRYLSQTNPAVSVTLVTEEKRMKGKPGQEIISVSQLFAAERPKTYRLLVDSSLHDRHIRCDGKIFHVGGTFKDVGGKDPCSITPADSPSIAATLDGHIAGATEWFGPNQPVHKS